MKVVLNQTLPKVGKEGQVVKVAPGFARNYLFPRGLAMIADKNTLAMLERRRSKDAAEAGKTKESALAMKDRLEGQTVRLVGKTAKGSTKLFGAITSADIADGIKEALDIEVDKKQVALLHPIKRIGVHDVLIDLHREVEATIRLEVTDEEGNLGLEEVAEAYKSEEQLSKTTAPGEGKKKPSGE